MRYEGIAMPETSNLIFVYGAENFAVRSTFIALDSQSLHPKALIATRFGRTETANKAVSRSSAQ